MKQRKMFTRLAAVMTMLLLATTAAPTFAAEGSANFLKRGITYLTDHEIDSYSNEISDEDAWEDEELSTQFRQGDARLATPSVAFRIQQNIVESKDRERFIRPVDKEYKGAPGGGMIGGTLTLYASRDLNTNQLIFPEPAVITVTQESGDDIGQLEIRASDAMESLLSVSVENGSNLALSSPVTFTVSLKEDWDGTGYVNNGSQDNYVMVTGPGGSPCWRIRVLYGADGPMILYSVEYATFYEGTKISMQGSNEYANVVDVDLNGTEAPSFTIQHHFRYYADVKDVWIESAKLNPDGQFTFADGTTDEKKLSVAADETVLIPLKMKQDTFTMWRKAAISGHKDVRDYKVMSDLVIAYNDGYEAGGIVNPLPLVYCFTYSSPSGGGGSGSGGSGGGSTTSGVAVDGPTVTPRTTIASADDVGWIFKDGVWCYMDAANKPVTDWLLGPDGRWYFLDLDGVMKTGWIQLEDTWYFLNADGAMATGWVQNTDGKWYYLLPSGAMSVNNTTPDGYQVDGSGAWLQE